MTLTKLIGGVMILIVAIESIHAQQPILSPRDSVELVIGGKKISVNYGRPSMRGRKIFGALLPYDQWWRTGANEATSFVTEADLVMGGAEIPKGSHTIYTLPSETKWKIMINKETGQWGTIYHPEYDLVRLPLKKRALKEPVEKFTILLERTNNHSGVMKLLWETTELSIDFKLKEKNSKNSH